MKEKEITEGLVEKLNAIQLYYNPTNLPFILFEEHDIKENKIHIGIKHTDWSKGKQILLDQKYYYKEFKDGLLNSMYKDLNDGIIRQLLFRTRVKEIIQTIQVLQ